MILYHGSNLLIENIDLSKCCPYKDFGRGFYLTDIKSQAERMALRTVRTFKGVPTLTAYEFNIEDAKRSGLKIKIFESPGKEWARFVMKNRDMRVPQPCHDYDIVIGPVADDTVARLLRMFAENFIDEEQLSRELTFSKVTSQYFFRTKDSIKLLKRI